MTEKQIGGNGMAKRQPTVLRVPENGAGDPFFGRQGNWFEVIFESSYDGFYITDGNAIPHFDPDPTEYQFRYAYSDATADTVSVHQLCRYQN